MKSVVNQIHFKMNLYWLNTKKGASLKEHLDSFTKLLAELVNYDDVIQDEAKAMCLVNSLPKKI